jgi:hypothetical protein
MLEDESDVEDGEVGTWTRESERAILSLNWFERSASFLRMCVVIRSIATAFLTPGTICFANLARNLL